MLKNAYDIRDKRELLLVFAMRHLESPRIMSWCNIIDFLFLASLTLQVVAGFITVYTFI
jgi:hypothetical protein